MNNNQSEALRWANILTLNVGSQLINRKQAAAELRRLHEENQQWQEKCNTYIQIHDAVVKDNERLHEMNAELVEALKDLLGEVTDGYEPHEVFIAQAKAALRKAHGDNNG